MNYEKRDDKYVFEKGGVYFALTLEQIGDMAKTLAEIQKAAGRIGPSDSNRLLGRGDNMIALRFKAAWRILALNKFFRILHT